MEAAELIVSQNTWYPKAGVAKVSQNTWCPKAGVATVSQNTWCPKAGVAQAASLLASGLAAAAAACARLSALAAARALAQQQHQQQSQQRLRITTNPSAVLLIFLLLGHGCFLVCGHPPLITRIASRSRLANNFFPETSYGPRNTSEKVSGDG